MAAKIAQAHLRVSVIAYNNHSAKGHHSTTLDAQGC